MKKLEGPHLIETNLPGVYSVRGPLPRHPELREEDRIHPRFTVVSDQLRTRLPTKRERQAQLSGQRNAWVSPNWSGCAVQQAGIPFTYVDGIWRTPSITKGDLPAGTDGTWQIYSWVGLDGYGENELLQIGTSQSIDANGNVHCRAWYEWLAIPTAGSPPYVSYTAITNFPVEQGQTFRGVVEYLKDENGKNFAGSLTLVNNTTGKHTSFCLQPPPNVSMLGGSAEWILENPGASYPECALASFAATKFSVCSAGPTNKRPGDGDVLNIQNHMNGKVMTRVDSEPSSDEFFVAYYNR